MAKSSKRGRSGTPKKPDVDPTVVEDAVVVSQEGADGVESAATDADTRIDEIVDDIVAKDKTLDEVSDGTVIEDQTISEPVLDDVIEDTRSEPVPENVPVVAAAPVTVKKVGFLPTALGGIVAGGIGYVVGTMGLGATAPEDTVTPQLEAQAAQIAELETALANLPEPAALPELPDFDALQASISNIDAATTAQSETLDASAASLADLDERLIAVERAPTAAGEVAETAITSIEREMGQLRAEIAEQQAQMQAVADTAASDVAAAQALAAEQEAAAQAASEAAEAEASARLATAAVAEIRSAVDSGAPFDVALSELQDLGVAIPEGFDAIAAEGAVTASDLQSGFPDAARAALASVRSEGGEDSGGGLSSFFANQLNVRSTAPREGDDPDAVLSRAEASVAGGDLNTALTEIEALPDSAKAALADWLDLAAQRQSATDALDTLSSAVNN